MGRADADYPATAAHPVHAAKAATPFSHFITGFQAISTLIGVPLALASGYTLYRTNYAPDATCTSLRASIVSMLDKNVDPATRRMLVKRDVEAFERSCGTVDPDAHAAFKALLAADKIAVAPVKPVPQIVAVPKPVAAIAPVQKDVAKDVSKDTVKDAVKAELRPTIVDKKPADGAAEAPVARDEAKDVAKDVTKDVAKDLAKVETKPETKADTKVEAVAKDTPMSDTRWLDAVRQALVEPAAEPAAAPRQTPRAEPVVTSKPGEPVLQPAWSVSQPAAEPQPAAAALPQPVGITTIADPNRPVPPASVPAAQYAQGGSWVANIPFVGRMIDRGH